MTAESIDAVKQRLGKHESLIVREADPFNAEPPPARLRESFITPNALFYVRNHAPVPRVDANSFRLEVEGMIREDLSLSLADIREGFAAYEVTATLACAGNRRTDLARVRPIPGEVPWGNEAISTARWRGARLADVLAAAGVEREARHVAFLGLDEVEKHDSRFNFGGSIPVEAASNESTLLAYEMNGEPLPPTHGAPLRVVVPGYIGARSVKWLKQIMLQHEPSDNYYQRHAYKIFPIDVTSANVDWSGGKMLGESVINSVICVPVEGAALEAGAIKVSGYAIASGLNRLEQVELSTDDGATWTRADLATSATRGAWTLWDCEVRVAPGAHTLVVRAADSSGATQPPSADHIWNFKGYMNNAWHRVGVMAR